MIFFRYAMHKVYLYYTVEAKLMEYIFMCIGNRDGGDDAVGPYIADKLKKEWINNSLVLDCGTVPENFTSVIKQHNPKNLVIIDAIEMGLKPGEVRIVQKDKIGIMHISTHGIPISVLINYLEEHVDNILLIGIQPKAMSGEMTETVKKKSDILIDLIKEKKIEKIQKLN